MLNLENWQNLIYTTVRASNWGAALYFVAWIILGKYIFLTLFLAVTLDAFETKYKVSLFCSLVVHMTGCISGTSNDKLELDNVFH